jgi:hypothetical protein
MGSPRDPRMDRLDYRPDVYGLVEGPVDTPPHIVAMALAFECPDCLVNVFIEKDPDHASGFGFTVAHDEFCPWMTQHEAGEIP